MHIALGFFVEGKQDANLQFFGDGLKMPKHQQELMQNFHRVGIETRQLGEQKFVFAGRLIFGEGR